MKPNRTMKNIFKSAASSIAVAGLMAAGSTLATEMPPLVQKYGCSNCHAVDVKMIGPSWMDISRAYNSNGKTSIGIPVADILKSKTAEESLKLKISHGGAGNWGTVLMPGTDPSDTWQANVDTMVGSILGLSKGSTSKEDMLKMANKYYCTGCHAIDKKVIGPSWMDVSKAYNSNGTTSYGVKVADILRSKTPEEWLTLKISHGGLGNWGTMVMPAMEYRGKAAQSNRSQDDPQKREDIKQLVQYILGLAKQ